MGFVRKLREMFFGPNAGATPEAPSDATSQPNAPPVGPDQPSAPATPTPEPERPIAPPEQTASENEAPRVRPRQDRFLGQQLLERVGILQRHASDGADGGQKTCLGHCFAIQPDLIFTSVSLTAKVQDLRVHFPRLMAQQSSNLAEELLWQSSDGTLALLRIKTIEGFKEECSLRLACFPDAFCGELTLCAFPFRSGCHSENGAPAFNTSVSMTFQGDAGGTILNPTDSENEFDAQAFHGVPCFFGRYLLGLVRACPETNELSLVGFQADVLKEEIGGFLFQEPVCERKNESEFDCFKLAFYENSPRQKVCWIVLEEILTEKDQIRPFLRQAMSQYGGNSSSESLAHVPQMVELLLKGNINNVFFCLRYAVERHFTSLNADNGNPNQYDRWKDEWRPVWACIIKQILINDLRDDLSYHCELLSQSTSVLTDVPLAEVSPSIYEDAIHQLNITILHLMNYEGDLQLRRAPNSDKIYANHGFFSSHMPIRDGGSQHVRLEKTYLFNSVLGWLKELKDPEEAGRNSNRFRENLQEQELVDIKAEIKGTISNIRSRDKMPPFFYYDHWKPWGHGVPLNMGLSNTAAPTPDQQELGEGISEAALGQFRELFPDLVYYQDDGRFWFVRIFRTEIGEFINNLAGLVEKLNHPAGKKNQGKQHAQ